MNKRKMQIYPPIIVCLVVLLALAAALASTGKDTKRPQMEQPAVKPTAQPVRTTRSSPTPVTSLEPLVTTTAAPPKDTPQQEPEAEPEPEPEYQSMIGSRDWDADEALMLMKIAMAEAEGESVEGKALVILVVLNRVWSDDFPDTIEQVIFQKNQFTPTNAGGRYWTTEPNAECAEALRMVEEGWDKSQGAMYFESTGKDGWHSQNLEFLFQWGGHKFYR